MPRYIDNNRRLGKRDMSGIEEVVVTTYTDDFFLIGLDPIPTTLVTPVSNEQPLSVTQTGGSSVGPENRRPAHHDGPNPDHDGPYPHHDGPPLPPFGDDHRPSSPVDGGPPRQPPCTDKTDTPYYYGTEPPYREPEESSTPDWDPASSPTSLRDVTVTTSATVTDTDTLYDGFPYSATPTGKLATSSLGSFQAQTTVPPAQPPISPDFPPPANHSALKFILIGVFLGAFGVLAILCCAFFAKRAYSRRKKNRITEGGRRDSESSPPMQQLLPDATTRSVSTIIPSSATQSRTIMTPSTTTATPSTRATIVTDAEEPLILNPFTDPTYNAGSGVDDYMHDAIAPRAVAENPFIHPDDGNAECTVLVRPNSQGDFPPEYMTIDNDNDGGQGHSTREERFPFGDPALTDDGGSTRSVRHAPSMGAGFGDGFRGYVFSRGLGTELGQGTGEGFSGHITDSDTATITESRPSIDVTSVRRSSDCPISDDLPEIDDDRGYVADGFGYRPARR